MALQVRLRHALGEKVVELPGREVTEPLVIGRGREADLQIPSVGVAPRHCALFLHEEKWVVQGLAGVTKVNGSPVEGPRLLNIGDVLTVGTDPTPPAIEIDPLAAADGRTGPAGSGQWMPPPPVARPMAPAGPSAPVPAPQPYTAPQYVRAQAPAPMPPPVPPPMAYETSQPAVEQTEDSIEWATDTAQRPTRYYIPKRKQSSAAGAILAILFGFLLLGGVAFVAYQQLQAKQPVVKAPPPPPPPVVQEEDSHVHSKLFDVNGDQQKGRQAHRNQSPSPPARNPAVLTHDEPPTSYNPSPSTDAEPQGDPAHTKSPDSDSTGKGGSTPALEDADNEIESAHLSTDNQGVAILKYDDYRRLHPGRHAQELDKYTEDALDRLWWQRIDQLWKKRDRLTGDIKKAEQDIAAQPAGAFHNQLVKQKADLEAQRAKVEETLKGDMAYTSDTGPDLNDPKQLAELAKTRDGAKYADFRKRTLASVRAHHGELPWAGDQ